MERLTTLWENIRDSFWFVPTCCAVTAVGLAFGGIALDRTLDSGRRADMWFVFGIGADGARGVLSAIAQAIITVTGIVFSVTVVALQLASTQFTPRVLRTFIRDRPSHWALGTFVGTFTFCLLVLRTVVSGDDPDIEKFVPSLSVSFAVVLGVLSIAMLLYLINHIAMSLRASSVIARVTQDALIAARTAFHPDGDQPSGLTPAPPTPPEQEGIPLQTPRSGYVVLIDEGAILKLGKEHGPLVVRFDVRAGTFVTAGERIGTYWPRDKADARRVASKILATLLVESDRLPRQDVERGLLELADVACKALSPASSDPTTAVMAIHRVGEVLSVIACGVPAPAERRTDDGAARVQVPRPSFQELAGTVFERMGHYAGDQPVAFIALADAADRVAVASTRHRPVLGQLLTTLREVAWHRITEPVDRARVLRHLDDTMARWRALQAA